MVHLTYELQIKFIFIFIFIAQPAHLCELNYAASRALYSFFLSVFLSYKKLNLLQIGTLTHTHSTASTSAAAAKKTKYASMRGAKYTTTANFVYASITS